MFLGSLQFLIETAHVEDAVGDKVESKVDGEVERKIDIVLNYCELHKVVESGLLVQAHENVDVVESCLGEGGLLGSSATPARHQRAIPV